MTHGNIGKWFQFVMKLILLSGAVRSPQTECVANPTLSLYGGRRKMCTHCRLSRNKKKLENKMSDTKQYNFGLVLGHFFHTHYCSAAKLLLLLMRRPMFFFLAAIMCRDKIMGKKKLEKTHGSRSTMTTTTTPLTFVQMGYRCGRILKTAPDFMDRWFTFVIVLSFIVWLRFDWL